MATHAETPAFFRWQADTANRRFARAVNDPELHVMLVNRDDESVVWESQPPAGMLQVEGGSKWPDVLENTSLTGLYVAERVVEALDARWPQSFEAEQLAGVQSKCRAKPGEAPRYYRLTPKGSVAFDLEASNLAHLELDAARARSSRATCAVSATLSCPYRGTANRCACVGGRCCQNLCTARARSSNWPEPSAGPTPASSPRACRRRNAPTGASTTSATVGHRGGIRMRWCRPGPTGLTPTAAHPSRRVRRGR